MEQLLALRDFLFPCPTPAPSHALTKQISNHGGGSEETTICVTILPASGPPPVGALIYNLRHSVQNTSSPCLHHVRRSSRYLRTVNDREDCKRTSPANTTLRAATRRLFPNAV